MLKNSTRWPGGILLLLKRGRPLAESDVLTVRHRFSVVHKAVERTPRIGGLGRLKSSLVGKAYLAEEIAAGHGGLKHHVGQEHRAHV